ncbi:MULTISPECIES: F0F1 ATP synthase subunit A [Atopobiaceae]|uniref:F0F1 ATP synthase subunit A n=1 Tax=Atopobiaceae TaxID=1643824 RepID=UPI00034E03DA|nr:MULTISPECIES: F0F1 ATP synthase subunit A [Atopobiaceae]EPD78862.1 ATP synthase F0, A subunit [Atopobium sp. oral taxon 199 str. F0494]
MNPLSQLPEKMDELLDSFMTHPLVGSTTVGFTNYIFWMCVALVLLMVVMFIFVQKQKRSLVPQGIFVNSIEYLVEFIRDDMVKGLLGDTWKKHFSFLASLFLFILANNIVGIIPGCHPGTGTIGVTAALALCSFVYFIVVGVRRMGPLGYIKSLAPEGVNPFMGAMVWVIELFSTFLRLITLAVRLFCNMLAGHVVMGVFAILVSLFMGPILQGFSATAFAQAGASAFWLLILIVIYAVELLVGVIQAYVFTLLSSVYIQLVESE